MNVFLNARDRPLVLKTCLPSIRRACDHLGGKLTVIDDASGPEASALLHDHADEVVRNDRPGGKRGTIVQEMQLALDRGLDRWLHCDADVLLGPDALLQMAEAAEVLEDGECSTLVALSLIKLPGDGDLRRGRFRFRRRPEHPRGWEKLALFDPLRLVFGAAVRKAGAGALKSGTWNLAHRSGMPVLLIRPQVEACHLGFRAASGRWHSDRYAKSLWVQQPAVDADTGAAVQVGGFDLEAWTAAAKAGEEHLRELVEHGKLSDIARKKLPALVRAVTSQAQAAPLIEEARRTGRRILLEWAGGRWSGEQTRRTLGVTSADRIVRVCPYGAKHPWRKA